MDLKSKLNDLRSRRYGDDLNKGLLFEGFSGKIDEEILYISEAMRPVDSKYTQNTFEQCRRVQEQLKANISAKHSGIEFDFQGSVPLNTHTRRHSDVDMLVATGRFHFLKPPLIPTNPYNGDDVNDLLELRNDIVDTIQRVFYAVDIDNKGGKAVTISGGSLNRKIDLVSMSWLHTPTSRETGNKIHRGIKIYDKNDKRYIENFPFLHMSLCETKDSIVQGKFKRLVRYIKNVRKDSDKNIKISSYDATALMYHQDNSELTLTSNNPAELSRITELYLKSVINDVTFQRTALVPNGTRLLFSDEGLKLSEVIKLYEEVRDINSRLLISYGLIDIPRKNLFEEFFRKAS